MPNILDVARMNPDFSLAVILIERANLTAIFSCAGPFTVQLPNNAAISNIDATQLNFLLLPENQDVLRNVILYHIVPGSFPTTALRPGTYPTLSPGNNVTVTLNPTMFDNATVITPDVQACNGIINGIDRLLTFLNPGTFRACKFSAQPLYLSFSSFHSIH